VELGLEDVEDGFELHVVGRGEHEVHLLLGDLVLGALEVVARLDLALGLIDGVGDFLHVDLAGDIEAILGGHGRLLSSAKLQRDDGRPLGGVNAKRVSGTPG